MERLKYDIVRPPSSIPYPKVRRDQPLIMSQLGIVLIVLAVGLGLTFPVFLCELIKGRGKKTLNESEERKHLTLGVIEHLTLADIEHLTLAEIEHLTLHHYGRTLEEYL